MRHHKTYLIFSILFLSLLASNFIFAQGLEIEYPQVGGTRPETVTTPLPNYVKYIFDFAIVIAGLVVFGALVYGGFQYLTSVGDPSKTGDAKDQIFAAILGLIVLLGSYLLLNTINPQLVTLKEPGMTFTTPTAPTGVYLCKDAQYQECLSYGTDQAVLPASMEDQVKYISFDNQAGIAWGAVLHENKNQKGTCAVYLTDSAVTLPNNGGVSSITVFKQATNGGSGEGVTLYECSNFDTTSEAAKLLGVIDIGGHICQQWGPYPGTLWKYNLGEKGRSIKISNEGKYLTALFEGENGTKKCEVFIQSDRDLTNNYIGACGTVPPMACFNSITVVPIQ